jgi:hypothetical protein
MRLLVHVNDRKNNARNEQYCVYINAARNATRCVGDESTRMKHSLQENLGCACEFSSSQAHMMIIHFT